jgi:hypothetical protein
MTTARRPRNSDRQLEDDVRKHETPFNKGDHARQLRCKNNRDANAECEATFDSKPSTHETVRLRHASGSRWTVEFFEHFSADFIDGIEISKHLTVEYDRSRFFFKRMLHPTV